MSVSKIITVISFLLVGGLSACTGPGNYPITGMEVSQDDPVKEMNDPIGLRGEVR